MIYFLLFSVALSILACMDLNVWRGQPDKRPLKLLSKTVCIVLMGLALAGPVSTSAVMHGLPSWFGFLMIPAFFVQIKPSWGELFPHGRNTAYEDFAAGVKPITNKLSGINYNIGCDEHETRYWQTIGMGVRHALYGIPIALVLCVTTLSAAPLAYILCMMLVGLIYRRSYQLVGEPYFVAHAEKWVGGYIALIVGVLVL